MDKTTDAVYTITNQFCNPGRNKTVMEIEGELNYYARALIDRFKDINGVFSDQPMVMKYALYLFVKGMC